MSSTFVARKPGGDEVEEMVPVSGWAKEGITPSLPRAMSQAQLVEYGPLTAQGNFLSHMDNEELGWQPLASAESISNAQAPFYNVTSDYQPASYGVFASNDGPTMVPWTGINGDYVNAAYSLYEPRSAVTSDAYETISPSQSYYNTLQSPAFVGPNPGPSIERTTLGPWDGIWKFNPNNVAENFVYPTTEEPVKVNAEASISPSHSAPQTHMNVAHPVSYTVSPTDNQSAIPNTWVVVAEESPTTRSEPKPSPPGAATSESAHLEAQMRHNSDANHVPRTLKAEKVKRNKTLQTQLLVPRRQGPLSVEQRQKADDMRYYGACWRCRRYKKPCNGPGECDTCKTSGFRVWPSTIGCYRGNMEDFISGVMPGNAELIMRDLGDQFGKQPNWKVHFGYQPDMRPLPLLSGSEDRFTKLSVKLQATRMAGPGFIELLEILANFQRSRTKPDMCLEHACEALSYICDVYHAFVKTDTSINLLPSELLTALTKFRSHYSANWRHFLALCLSGRRNAWFPAFLCATINVPLLVVLKDGFVAIPEPTRSSLWPNISFLIEDLRNRLYPMGLDLLSALAKGIKPWQLKCWGMVPRLDPNTKKPIPGRFERDPDGLRLLAGDVGAFDGFAAIQAWLERHRESMYYGVSFLTTPPFSERNAKMQPVAALAWIFEVAPPGQKLVGGHLVEDPSAKPTASVLGDKGLNEPAAVPSAA